MISQKIGGMIEGERESGIWDLVRWEVTMPRYVTKGNLADMQLTELNTN